MKIRRQFFLPAGSLGPGMRDAWCELIRDTNELVLTYRSGYYNDPRDRTYGPNASFKTFTFKNLVTLEADTLKFIRNLISNGFIEDGNASRADLVVPDSPAPIQPPTNGQKKRRIVLD